MKDKIIEFLVNKGYIQESDKNVYYYGLYVMQLNLFTDIVLLFVSFLFNELYFGIMFLVFFDALRVYWGGYHAKSPTSCFISFILIYVINMRIFKYADFNMNKILVIVLLVIIFMTPSFKTRNEKIYNKNDNIKKTICIIYFLITMAISGKLINIMLFSLLTNIILHYYERIRKIIC